ncbi:hypothetical protein [Nocardia abscessus]|nr:hypothetical protein [Nocardia abscessus]
MFPWILAYDDYTAAVDAANYERVLGLVEDARARGARVQPGPNPKPNTL